MRTFLSLMLFLACPALASAQLRFAQPSVDLGELRGGPSYAHRFEFVNDGAQPIEITDFRLGCGCLQPTLDQRVYRPGEKGTLVMHLRTLGQQDGPRAWRAQVQYRQADKLLETGLVVAATLKSEVTVEPSVLAITVETRLKQELTIRDLRATPMKIVAVLATTPAVQVTTQPLGNGATKVIVEVDAAALKAPRQEEMLNILTSDPEYRHLQVPITLTKTERSAIRATPERVELVGITSQLVRLRSADDQPVRIEEIETDHPALKCTWAAGPGNDATVRIASLESINADTVVRIHLTGSASRTITIPVTLSKD